jgi:hypothetical protein
VDVDELVEHYPRLFHVTELGSWETIGRHGLLSVRAILDRFEVGEPLRGRLETQRRPAPVRLSHPAHGDVLIRDQRPLQETKLARCLTDMTVAEWLALLNSKVFFWVSEQRVQSLLEARAYRDREHAVLVVDTRSLLDTHRDRVTLTPINTGATIYDARPRGRDTFTSIADCPFDDWRRRRGARNAIVELAVEYAVPDVLEHTVAVERRRADAAPTLVWQRQ